MSAGPIEKTAERTTVSTMLMASRPNPDDFTDAQAVAAIERITRGNFRLLERLFRQINRVLKINQLETITDDVVEAAASTLDIGT